DWLERPSLDRDTLLARQAAVRWMCDQDIVRIDLAAALVNLRGEDRSMAAFDKAVRDARILLPTPALWLLRAWSAACAVLCAIAIYQAVAGNTAWMTGVSIAAILNSIVLAMT